MSENISLIKRKQGKFTKKTEKVKKRVKSGEIKIKEKDNKKPSQLDNRGIVLLRHIPHGFYEEEMMDYFKQFGKVTNLRLARSKKTGASKGYAFIEFQDADVAKIVAETMDNYLMFKKKLETKFIPSAGFKRSIFKMKPWTATDYPCKINRAKMREKKNTNMNDEEHIKSSKKALKSINKRNEKLKEMGINLNFVPSNIPDIPSFEVVIKKEETDFSPSKSEVDIEDTVPIVLKKKKKGVKSGGVEKKTGAIKKESKMAKIKKNLLKNSAKLFIGDLGIAKNRTRRSIRKTPSN